MATREDLLIAIKTRNEAAQGLRGTKSDLGGIRAALDAIPGPAKVAAAGIAAIGVLAVKAAIDTERAFAEVRTLLPDVGDKAFGSLRDDVMALSSEMGIATDQTVPALYQAISAGVPKENIIDFMRTAGKAAIGGVTDLETAVDGITSVVNAYGAETLSAGDASDYLFTAVRLGKTNFEQLSRSLFNVVPTAASLGIGLDEVAAQLAVITASGVPTSVATTNLRQSFVEASRESTKLGKSIKDELGAGFADLIKQGMTASDIFQQLQESMPENDFRNLFSSVEALNAVLLITGDNSDNVKKALEEMGGAAGSTSQAFDTIADTTGFKLQMALNDLKIILIELGSEALPAIADFLEIITPLIKTTMPLVEAFGQMIDQSGLFRALSGLSGGKPEKIDRTVLNQALNSPIPKYQHGTSSHPGGLAITGESGPELLNLPTGTSVTPLKMGASEYQALKPLLELMKNLSVTEAKRSQYVSQYRDLLADTVPHAEALSQVMTSISDAARDQYDSYKLFASTQKEIADVVDTKIRPSYIHLVEISQELNDFTSLSTTATKEAVALHKEKAEIVAKVLALTKEGFSETTAEALVLRQIEDSRNQELALIAEGIKGGRERLNLLESVGASYREIRNDLVSMLGDSDQWLDTNQMIQKVTFDIHGNIVETAQTITAAVTESRSLAEILKRIGKENVIVKRTIDDIWAPDDPNRPGGPIETGETMLHFAQALTNDTDLLTEASRRANYLRDQGLDISIAQNVAAFELNDSLQESVRLLLEETNGLDNVYAAMVNANVPLGEMLMNLKEFATITGAFKPAIVDPAIVEPVISDAKQRQLDQSSIPLPSRLGPMGSEGQ